MSIFGALIRTAVNVAITPVAVVKDVVAVANTMTGAALPEKSHTMAHLELLKEEADSDE